MVDEPSSLGEAVMLWAGSIDHRELIYYTVSKSTTFEPPRAGPRHQRRPVHVWHLPESIWILKILGFWILDSGSRYTDPSNRCENPELRIQIPFLGSGFWVLISLAWTLAQVLEAGVWFPDSGFWVLGSDVPPCTRVHEGCWGLDSGFRILDSGF
jgi:hypothetical protein